MAAREKKTPSGASRTSLKKSDGQRRIESFGSLISLGISVSRLRGLLNGRSPVSADTAMRLSRYFGTTPQFWMNLQSHYDLEIAETELADQIDHEVQPYRKSA
jgi:plasmid maintenance system antidote protein VapI